MTEHRDRTGVCILRVGTRADGLIIEIRVRTDVEVASTERTSAVVDVDAALSLVNQFLLEMATPEPGGGEHS